MKIKGIYKRIAFVVSALLLFVTSLFVPFSATPTAKAEEDKILAFDCTNVMYDLQGTYLNGEPFDINDYAFDTSRDVEIFSFVEYCYSYDSERQGNYGLYVYLWNPKGLIFVNDSTRNKIQFSYGEYYDIPVKYTFTILNMCEQAGYEGLFYKLKINLSEKEKNYILSSVNSTSRTYHISGIEILEKGKPLAEEYDVSTTFTYSGFSSGFGATQDGASTLTCTRDALETLAFDVHDTYYRPNGSNGDTSFSYDTLMSVYFSIPNKVLEEYDSLSGINCSFIKLATDWAYVTGRQDIYEELLNYIGKDSGNLTPGFYENPFEGLDYGFAAKTIEGDIKYRFNYTGENEGRVINRLDYIFWTGQIYNEDDENETADRYILPSERLYDWMLNYHENYGQADDSYLKVDGNDYPPYNAELFMNSQGVGKTTNVTIRSDDTYKLVDQKISQNWWQSIWNSGSTVDYTKVYDGIEGIKRVTDDDLYGSLSDISERLYITPLDVSDFVDFYEAEIRKGNTVFLLRYDIGSYQVFECSQGTPDNDGFVVGFNKGDTNAYLFAQNVYLNFDIIYCEFEKDGETVVIPVVASPIDIVPSSQYPQWTTTDEVSMWERFLNILLIILGAFAAAIFIVFAGPRLLVLVLNVLWWLMKHLFIILWWIICLPFRLLGKLFSRDKNE